MGTSAHKQQRTHPPEQRARRLLLLALLTGIALSLLALGGSRPADAQRVSELNSKADAARSRAEALAGRIEAQTAALTAKRRQAASAAGREAELSATLQSGRERAAELAIEVEEARERLREARAELRRSVAMLSDRLVAIYKNGGPDALGVLLRADGYDDLALRSEYLERIRAADAALVGRARELSTQVSEQVEAVAAARRQQRAHNAEVEAARDQIAAVRAQAQARVSALATATGSQQAALGDLRAQIERWERQVQEAEQVSAAEAKQKVAEQIDGWAIPEKVVNCESGGDFSALNPSSGAGGAYQILPSTWKLYGGKGLPHEASPQEQSRIAALIWADSGRSAWVCAG
jgi:peptidoglycan hydrolase CwlO-like protein